MSNDNVFPQGSITIAAAQRMVNAAVEFAANSGRNMVVAVVDASGVLKAFARMDGAPLLSVDIAQNKAYSAASFGMPTDQWYEFIKDDPPLLHGIVHTPRLTVFGGGSPIFVDGALVGGVGASGGHYSDDMEVTQAALAALETN
jgi:uncharacterized protein GlcG (DUF336 family)